MSKNSNKDRRLREKAFGHYYKKHPFCDLDRCYYCGDYLSENGVGDHVPPISWAFALGYSYMVENESAPFLIVPCCKDCNVILGNKKYFTLRQRKSYIAEYLRSKYRSIRAIKEWEDEEIDELGDGLRNFISSNSDFRRFIERRISWAESD
jgi:hypothetical protein